MKEKVKKEPKEKKHRISKGEIAVKLIAGVSAFIMLLSVFSTGIYYIYAYFVA